MSRIGYPDQTEDTFAYDAEGHRTQISSHGPLAHQGIITNYVYDAVGRQVQTITPPPRPARSPHPAQAARGSEPRSVYEVVFIHRDEKRYVTVELALIPALPSFFNYDSEI